MGRQATRKLQHTLNRLRTKPRKIELQKCGIAMFLPVTTFAYKKLRWWFVWELFSSAGRVTSEVVHGRKLCWILRVHCCIAILYSSASVFSLLQLNPPKVPWICHLPTGILNMYRCAFLMPSSWTEHHTWRSLIRPSGDRSESGLQRPLIAKVKIMEDPFCKEGFKLVPKQVHCKVWQCMIGAVLLCVIAGEIAETNLSENVWQS